MKYICKQCAHPCMVDAKGGNVKPTVCPFDGDRVQWAPYINPKKADESSLHDMNGIERIVAERQRQIEKEGWTPEHDDEHYHGELVEAACAYALGRADLFPKRWSLVWWKTPRKKSGEINRIRELEKAGALIAAEIDRLLRLDARV